jgi:hypothetical protein
LGYSAPINDFELLQQRLENTSQEIQVKSGTFVRVRISVGQREEECAELLGNDKQHPP